MLNLELLGSFAIPITIKRKQSAYKYEIFFYTVDDFGFDRLAGKSLLKNSLFHGIE